MIDYRIFRNARPFSPASGHDPRVERRAKSIDGGSGLHLRSARGLWSENGFTLTEIVTASVVALLALGCILALMSSVSKRSAIDSLRAAAERECTRLSSAIRKDMRAASALESAGGVFTVTTNFFDGEKASPVKVAYSVEGLRVIRATPGGSSTVFELAGPPAPERIDLRLDMIQISTKTFKVSFEASPSSGGAALCSYSEVLGGAF